jgi:hypothetical protein
LSLLYGRQVASRLKFEVTDLDEGRYGLESSDAKYGIEIVKARLNVKPSLGLGLEELARGRDGRGKPRMQMHTISIDYPTPVCQRMKHCCNATYPCASSGSPLDCSRRAIRTRTDLCSLLLPPS